VGVIVDKPEAVATLVEAQVEVLATEFHPLGPFYLIP
jgi:hypothetical protein